MTHEDLQRLIKIEDRINQIAVGMGLKPCPIEWDVVPPPKMLEIMAYRGPTQVSSWKFGRDYEKIRTMYEHGDSIPMEVVINDCPARAYLMNSNPLAVQALVMAHVVGHVHFFTMNKWFKNNRRDIIGLLADAYVRFNEYERLYGYDAVEKTVDAAHALQFHSDPFYNESEEAARQRVYEQKRVSLRKTKHEFNDLTIGVSEIEEKKEVEHINSKIWQELRMKTPVEPVEDILRYVIDNSRYLDNWQKDILETLRTEGQYYWPIIKTKVMNEGYATWIHEQIISQLFVEDVLTTDEHGQYNYANSLVTAKLRMTMNPYLVGREMWKDIKERWDKGRYGTEYDNCTDYVQKEAWDTKEMKGMEKVNSVLETYTDWFFMQDFMTNKLIDDLDMYIYQKVRQGDIEKWVRTDHTIEQIRKIIVTSFSYSGIPKIEIINGNYDGNGSLLMIHSNDDLRLDEKYCIETLKHIYFLWGRPVMLRCKVGPGKGQDAIYKVDAKGVDTVDKDGGSSLMKKKSKSTNLTYFNPMLSQEKIIILQ